MSRVSCIWSFVESLPRITQSSIRSSRSFARRSSPKSSFVSTWVGFPIFIISGSTRRAPDFLGRSRFCRSTSSSSIVARSPMWRTCASVPKRGRRALALSFSSMPCRKPRIGIARRSPWSAMRRWHPSRKPISLSAGEFSSPNCFVRMTEGRC